ncbi:Uncharacterised protein [uncultured archaeon]|nr:Uncharacterised protein [uncultured archaeon]
MLLESAERKLIHAQVTQENKGARKEPQFIDIQTPRPIEGKAINGLLEPPTQLTRREKRLWRTSTTKALEPDRTSDRGPGGD